ncbi:UTP--glucose-1-phosphate uridylyltransferase [Phocicoccus pinnipedialis]|uniref:Putative uridylyltransferase n=1 Tax=Phocicoccus pinnipedialis TaxID=110845 RepID=A0A6V7RBY5_9BACL|nr:UTP--glucose-1-phosphate uridylyltransferase [Jeotgalicoccus pinnipedialis]MBP1939901.1 putative uridylyltransferase [Jeotgalicoccus pinnipedialis]CAD2074786.1 putative uridylyltransferase [Jeotgalicoccus pinnipedialis]
MLEKFLPQFEKLDQASQERVRETFESLNLDEIKDTYQDVYVNANEFDITNVDDVPFTNEQDVDKTNLTSLAEFAIKNGEVAVLLMAGGQGTRLNHPGPKGTFSFDGVSLFELQARQILKYKQDESLPVHWYIMTSDINHEETLAFFKDHSYFGVPGENIHFFKQEHFPALSKEGHLLLTENKDIMITPNGNGGIFGALKSNGLLEDMKARGIKHVFMNNVDNVVVKVLDPVLVGLHIDKDNEVTSKSITPKPGESVGRLANIDGKKGVLEYTELPEGASDKFRNGNIGIHVFSTDFLAKAATTKMPYHLAKKQLKYLDGNLNLVREEALKFEKFYFDAFKSADKHHTLQVDRKGEFSPLKNREGKDSVETAYNDLKEEGVL